MTTAAMTTETEPASTTPEVESTTPAAESTTPETESTTPEAESTTPVPEMTTPGETTSDSTTPSIPETTQSELTTVDTTTPGDMNPTTDAGDLTTTTTTDKPTPSPETSNCTNEELEGDQFQLVCPTGFKRHPKYCNLFYQCTVDPQTYNMKVLVLSCPNETVYDSRKIQCLPTEETEEECKGELADNNSLKSFQDQEQEEDDSPPPVSLKIYGFISCVPN